MMNVLKGFRHVVLAAVFLAAIGCPVVGTAEECSLDSAISMANDALVRLQDVADYTATLVKRERVDGELGDYEYWFIKVRHEPFSVYMKCLKPVAGAGREAIYVAGSNDGKLLAHDPMFVALGTLSLKPDGLIAMRGQRYPITELGLQALLRSLVERGEREKMEGTKIHVSLFSNAKVNGRPTNLLQLVRTKRSPTDDFYRVRVYIDAELQLPIRYEAHDWPSSPGEMPPVIEEYTYVNLRLNQGLGDADFAMDNAEYGFPEQGLLGSVLGRP
jgi:hypothetical protein